MWPTLNLNSASVPAEEFLNLYDSQDEDQEAGAPEGRKRRHSENIPNVDPTMVEREMEGGINLRSSPEVGAAGGHSMSDVSAHFHAQSMNTKLTWECREHRHLLRFAAKTLQDYNQEVIANRVADFPIPSFKNRLSPCEYRKFVAYTPWHITLFCCLYRGELFLLRFKKETGNG